MEVTTLDIAGDILTAADLLETGGWCRSSFTDDHGRHCADGWVAVATGALGPWGTPTYVNARYLAAVGVLGEQALREGAFSFIGYNDGQRDKRKVIRFMRRAARQLLAQ